MDEQLSVQQRLRELDRLGDDLTAVEQHLGQVVLDDDQVKRLLTINGVNITVAISLIAAIGDIARFRSPQKLVSYFGLNPRVRQSGLYPAHHGRISKLGRSHARAMLVEAAWATAKTPGPLRSFFLRIRARRGMQVAAVATARKLATIVWYILSGNEDYTWSRPASLPRSIVLSSFKPVSPREKASVDPLPNTASERFEKKNASCSSKPSGRTRDSSTDGSGADQN